jgi:predicted nuclease of restriction endonuclease-like (RecB) superfamily
MNKIAATADYILKDPYILEFLDLGENKGRHKDTKRYSQ